MSGQSADDPVGALNALAIAMGWGTRCYEDLDFVQPELNALRDVWRTKALAIGPLSRTDLDARLLKPFLPHISLIERAAEPSGAARYRMRLCGSEIVRRFGEQTGRFVDDFIPAKLLPRWTASTDAVLGCIAPLRLVSRFEAPQVSWLDGETFAAPLANGGAPPDTIFTATYFAKRQPLAATG
jgi:hypothetical protein